MARNALQTLHELPKRARRIWSCSNSRLAVNLTGWKEKNAVQNSRKRPHTRMFQILAVSKLAATYTYGEYAMQVVQPPLWMFEVWCVAMGSTVLASPCATH